jgi:hypothetical protein
MRRRSRILQGTLDGKREGALVSGGTLIAASSGTVSAAAPPVVHTIASPRAHGLGQHHAVAS